jgi:ribosomal protein L31E
LDRLRDRRFASPRRDRCRHAIALVGEKILEHHWDEIHADPELSKALISKGLRTASPETLRQQAALSRERGNADLAYYLEELADDRWREPEA